MVYKRYVKRGDKVYGPYLYKSVRVGKKVSAVYIGKNKNIIKSFSLWLKNKKV